MCLLSLLNMPHNILYSIILGVFYKKSINSKNYGFKKKEEKNGN